MAVKGSRCIVFRVNQDACNSKHATGVDDFLAGVGQQNRAESPALKCLIDSQTPQQGDGYRIAREFSRHLQGEILAAYTARTQ